MAEFNLIQALLDAEFKPEKDVPMKRFGSEAKFRVRALDEKERKRLMERATYGGEIDEEKFSALVIASCCVQPNWNDEQLLAGLGVRTAEEAVTKRLLPGELVKLMGAIHEISGFGVDEDDLKN